MGTKNFSIACVEKKKRSPTGDARGIKNTSALVTLTVANNTQTCSYADLENAHVSHIQTSTPL